MISNEFITQLDLELDYDILFKIARSVTPSNKPKSHQHNVDEYEYFKLLKSKFNIFSGKWNFYYYPPHCGLPPHIDAKRKATLNIPISGAEHSTITYYKCNDKSLDTTFIPEQVLYNINNSNLEAIYSFKLTHPTLIRTDIPHSVIAGNVERTIISWSISPDIDYEYAKAYFMSKDGAAGGFEPP